MTERQYVEHILRTAQSYMDSFAMVVREPGKVNHQSLQRWYTVKQELSAHLAIEMAQAWLESDAEIAALRHDLERSMARENEHVNRIEELEKALEQKNVTRRHVESPF